MEGIVEMIMGAITTFLIGATIVTSGVATFLFAGWGLVAFGILLFTVVMVAFMIRNR